MKRAKLVDFRFHDLRHSCGSALVQNGANLAEVATLLGHKSLQMTLRYSHVGNAGIERRNPGDNEILLSYAIPLPRPF